MDKEKIEKYLTFKNFTLDAIDHFTPTCLKIYNKMCYPDTKESKFVTCVAEEDFERDKSIADKWNKAAFDHNLWVDFVEYVKKSESYILIHRKRNLNYLLDDTKM